MKREYVLITGSSKGLGKALAMMFSKNRHDIILHGRCKEDLEKTKKEIIKNKVDCEEVIGDLRLEETINSLYKIAKKRDISVLINNAAVSLKSSLEEITNEQIDSIFETNLIAPIKLIRKIYPLFLEKREGTIININSLSGLEYHDLRSLYCASKWGLRGFTDTLRLEAEKDNIKILGIYPRRIRTKPNFTWGMDPLDVAQKIYNFYKNPSLNQSLTLK